MQQVGLTVRSFASQSNWRTPPVCPLPIRLAEYTSPKDYVPTMNGYHETRLVGSTGKRNHKLASL